MHQTSFKCVYMTVSENKLNNCFNVTLSIHRILFIWRKVRFHFQPLMHKHFPSWTSVLYLVMIEMFGVLYTLLLKYIGKCGEEWIKSLCLFVSCKALGCDLLPYQWYMDCFDICIRNRWRLFHKACLFWAYYSQLI